MDNRRSNKSKVINNSIQQLKKPKTPQSRLETLQLSENKLKKTNKNGTKEYIEFNKLIIRKIREQKRKEEQRLIMKTIEQNKSMKFLKPKLRQRQILSLTGKEENEIDNRKDMLKRTE